MHEIDPFMICHYLHLDLTTILVIKREWNHRMERIKIIKIEIDKLKDANFTLEVHHPIYSHLCPKRG